MQSFTLSKIFNIINNFIFNFVAVASLLSRVQLFVTPWTAARQSSLFHHLPEFPQTHMHWVSDAFLLRLAQQAGFLKAPYGERMRNETQKLREKWRSGDQHRSKVKVPKLNPSQLYYTFNREWKNMRELNYHRKNEGMELKQQQCPVVDGAGDRSKVRCCKNNIA